MASSLFPDVRKRLSEWQHYRRIVCDFRPGKDRACDVTEVWIALCEVADVALDFLAEEYPNGTDHPADAEAARLSRALEALHAP